MQKCAQGLEWECVDWTLHCRRMWDQKEKNGKNNTFWIKPLILFENSYYRIVFSHFNFEVYRSLSLVFLGRSFFDSVSGARRCRVGGIDAMLKLEKKIIWKIFQANPRGMQLDTTLVLMEHPVFLTQGDRAYHIQCKYLEEETVVTHSIHVR